MKKFTITTSIDLKKTEQKMKLDLEILKKYLISFDLDKAREYRASCIPDFLSKFYSLTDNKRLNNKKLKCLAKDYNWYEYQTNQNDPFDMRMGFVDEAYAKKTSTPQENVDMEKDVLNMLVDGIVLCSFADSDYRNLPMWAYYANNYQGYCVNYKINDKENFSEVIYQNERTRLNELLSVFMDIFPANPKGGNIKLCQDVFVEAMRIILSLKQRSWRHEKEYRIIYHLNKDANQRISNKKMGLEVNDITIGLKCKPEYKERIMQIAKDRKIKCYQLCTNENKFLSRQRIKL